MEEIVRKLKPEDMVSISAEELLRYIDGYNRFEFIKNNVNPITFTDIYRIKVAEQVEMDLVVDYYRSQI